MTEFEIKKNMHYVVDAGKSEKKREIKSGTGGRNKENGEMKEGRKKMKE